MGNGTFIEELVQRINKGHTKDLGRVTVVFPNVRAGLFFQQALARLSESPIWMPKVISMEQFVFGFSSMKKMEKLEAIFALYETYKKHQRKEETFDQFYFWGEMILRDFEEIDQYLINTDQLFTSIRTQKELDEEFYFLSEEDKETIQSFWSSFLPKATKSQEAFLETWKILRPIYRDFTDDLKKQGRAYGGLIYREVAAHLPSIERSTDPIYFAGFNALTHAEEKIMKHFVSDFQAQVVWDLDAYYFEDRKQEAGFFLRQYAEDEVLGKTFETPGKSRFLEEKQFTATAVSLEVGQTKALAELLDEMVQNDEFEPEKTVIVLPMEHMLFPVLHSIPESIEHINITMGYPMRETPVYGLLENVLLLQYHVKNDLIHGRSFYYQPLIELLEHPLLFVLEETPIKEIIADIKRRNVIRLYPEEINLKHKVFELILEKPERPLAYLNEILKVLYDTWKDKGHDLELEFISRFYEEIGELDRMMGERAQTLSYDFLIKLFRRFSRSLKVPFTGEPLKGLQIMGILETRNLDFENVFILNMNEESWPAAPRNGSFIPFNIRKAFDLPVFDHQDAIYSYLFYRLIQRAKKVHFFHNTVAEFNVNGELSRLVQQLEVESGFPIGKRILSSPIKNKPPDKISIQKNELIEGKMNRYLTDFTGSKTSYPSALTPSAINAYLDCRLRFYFKYVEKLYEPDEVQEEMDPMIFGNILHDSMELLYKQFTKKEKRDTVYPEDLFWIEQGVNGAINSAFIKHYGIKNEKKFKLEGRSLIAADILKKFVRKILQYDQQYAPFSIIGLEVGNKQGFQLEYPIELPNGNTKSIRLKGIIDRLDIKDGKVRVIDYKTGRDEKFFTTMEALIDREERSRQKASFQVFFYSYIFYKKYTGEYSSIEPGIFNSRDLFKSDFEWKVLDKSIESPVSEFRNYLTEFEEVLSEVLTEIWNPDVPFDQTNDLKKCGYCPYKEVCHR